MPSQRGGYFGRGQRNDTRSQEYKSPSSTNKNTSYNDSRAQRTESRPSHPNWNRPSPLHSTGPSQHRNHYSPRHTPYSSPNPTNAICHDQHRQSTIRGVFREVNILEQKLANLRDMLRGLEQDEDNMDWEYVDTVVIDNGKIFVIKGGVNRKG